MENDIGGYKNNIDKIDIAKPPMAPSFLPPASLHTILEFRYEVKIEIISFIEATDWSCKNSLLKE